MIADQIFLILVAIFCTSIGGVFWRFTMARWPVGLQWLGLALPLGLGLCGTWTGLAGTLISFRFGLLLLLAAGILSLLTCLTDFIRSRQPISFDYQNIGWKNGLTISRLVLSGMILTAWLGLHSPVTDGDALCYHLEVAKRMVQSDRLTFDSDLHETAYPLVVESLQAVALFVRGPVATRGIAFLFGISLAYATALLARPFVGEKRCRWAGVSLLSSPIVHCGMISPLNDVALAALCVAGLATWLIQKEEQTPIYASLFMTGIFSGLACGVKFPGMVWASTLALMIVADTFNDPSLSFRPKFLLKKTSVALFIYTATLLISGGFWYSRAAVLTGNPVHPYFRETFGGHGLDEVLAEDRKTPVQMVLNILTAPMMMVFAPSSFDSFSHQVGPVFLALIPLGLFLGMPWPWYRLVAVGWLVMALCLTQRQSPRFYISMLGPWSAASAVVAFHLQQNVRYQMGRWSFPFASAIVMSLTCLTTLFNLIRTKTSVAMLAGLISPSQWLIENEPTVQIGHWVDANLPKEAKLIGQDHRAFYWPRPFTMEKAHRRRLALLEAKPISNEVIQHFMDSGFTHLVLAEPMPIEAVEFDPALSLHLESWIASHQPILDTTVQEHDGFARRYRIFALDDSKANWPDTLQWAENGSILSDPELQRSSFSSETFISPPEIHP